MQKIVKAIHGRTDWWANGNRNRAATAGQQVLAIAFVAGLAIRLLILGSTTHLGLEIVDEQHYAQLAGSLRYGYGFAWAAHEPTSMRPPAYPGFVAAIWSFAGDDNHQAVRAAQVVLALVTSWLVYLIGVRVFDGTVGACAAAAVWLYPSLIFFNFTVLTETLFTTLLLAFVLLAVVIVEKPGIMAAAGCGVALGVAALTRSVMWPVPIVFCPLVGLMLWRERWMRVAVPVAVLVGYSVVVVPWAVRNTMLQHAFTVVDVLGGYNLRMGNYEYTPDDRMWDVVALGGEKSWSYDLGVARPGERLTEGQKAQWAQREAFSYMLAHPLETARRNLIKFADFWSLEREFVAGVAKQMYAPPVWFAVLGGTAITVSYVLLIVTASAGAWLAPPAARAHLLLLFPVLVITGAHTLTFGHSRYHLPLIPILALYSMSFLIRGRDRLQAYYSAKLLGAAATIAIFVIIWLRQLVWVDAARLGRLLNG